MAKKNVVIFDGEDKFINPKKAVYSKSKGQSKKAESFKSIRAALYDEEGPIQSYSEQVQDGNVSNNQTTVSGGSYASTAPIEVASQYNIPNAPQNLAAAPILILSDVPAPPVNLPSLGDIVGGGSSLNRPMASMDYKNNIDTITPQFGSVPQYSYVAPTPQLPSTSNDEELRRKTLPIDDISSRVPISTSTVTSDVFLAPTPKLPSFSASSPISGLGLSFGQNATTKSCPAGFRDYFGTCVPITNTQGACQQGYMKEYVDGPCVPIPASDTIGGCAAGYEYKMGYRSGSLTPEMGCYPIGSYQDINTGGSTGAILGGGSGSNIGGGGTTQGGGGIYGDLGNPNTVNQCPEYTVYDPVSGTCRAAYENAVVPCPAGYILNAATGTCIESTNPKDFRCPPVNLPNPPKCKKYAVVGKDKFGCDRYELVDDAANCPEVIQEKPIKCQDGLIYSEAYKRCINPIDETKKPPLTTPEGTCPEGFEFNTQQQKCISKCPTGKTFDPVNKICVDPTIYTPAKPYCSANQVWDEVQQKCIFTGTVDKTPVTSQTTTTTTKAPNSTTSQTTTTTTKAPNSTTSQTTTTTTKKPTLGQPPTGGGGASGGGGGGSEEAPAVAAAKKNYFWWYVGGAVLTYYLYKKYYNKK